MALTVKTRWWEVFPRLHRIYDGDELVAVADRIALGNDSETFSIEDTSGENLGTLKVELRMALTVTKGDKPFTLSFNKQKITGEFVNLEGHTKFKYGKKNYVIKWPEPKHPRENLQFIEVANGKNVVAKAVMDVRSSWERDVQVGDEFKKLRIPMALVLGRKVGFVGSEYVYYF